MSLPGPFQSDVMIYWHLGQVVTAQTRIAQVIDRLQHDVPGLIQDLPGWILPPAGR